jgi:hypothetical protein
MSLTRVRGRTLPQGGEGVTGWYPSRDDVTALYRCVVSSAVWSAARYSYCSAVMCSVVWYWGVIAHVMHCGLLID